MAPRTARVGSLLEHTPVTTAPRIRYDWPDLIVLGVIRPAWSFRTELSLAGLVAAVWLLLIYGLDLGTLVAAGLVQAAVAVLVLLPWTRTALVLLLHRSHLRRRWTLACRHANLATLNDRVPVIRRIDAIP